MPDLIVRKIRYEVFGPFPFDRSNSDTHREALEQFWENQDKGSGKGLREAVGVYVWTAEEQGRQVPWNVGRTARQGFEVRLRQKSVAFPLHAVNPEVYFVALRTKKKGEFRKPTKSKEIASVTWLERLLIEAALRVNPDLRNKASSKFFRAIVVPGFLNDAEETRSSSAEDFAKMFA